MNKSLMSMIGAGSEHSKVAMAAEGHWQLKKTSVEMLWTTTVVRMKLAALQHDSPEATRHHSPTMICQQTPPLLRLPVLCPYGSCNLFLSAKPWRRCVDVITMPCQAKGSLPIFPVAGSWRRSTQLQLGVHRLWAERGGHTPVMTGSCRETFDKQTK